jgi:fumarate hydratase class I
VDSITGRNTGDNTGPGSPVFHFHQWREPHVEVKLMLKGGGCENMNAQYSLPHPDFGGRDLKGVENAILDCVLQAQGQGCGPGILGVCIGGDRGTGYGFAKEQLLRLLDDTNPDPVLADLESRVVEKANQSGIGPMGFGGKTTLLACKIGTLNRLPASFFVSIAYMCWAYRRRGANLDVNGNVAEWLY